MVTTQPLTMRVPTPVNTVPLQQKRYSPVAALNRTTLAGLLSSCRQLLNTVTLKEQFCAPVAEQVTVVVPTGKILPEAGEHITGPQVPTAVGSGNVTTALLAIGQEAAAATVWSGGQVIDPPAGTLLENSEVLPMGSVAVEVTSPQFVTGTFRVVL